jgi:excisionase family DNA binding protein
MSMKTTVTVKELANILEISESRIKRMVINNQIPVMRIKNRVKFVISILFPWVEQNMPEKHKLLEQYVINNKNL